MLLRISRRIARCARSLTALRLLARDVYEAFTKLKHAYDAWNSHHLYLVTNEDYREQAEWLLTGAFHQIRHDTRVVHWRKFAELSDVLVRANILEKG